MPFLLEHYTVSTVSSIIIILGILFIIDSAITSSLKTPLQRLSMKVENSPITEEEKKKLLSKTQEANEMFKETFKRFGLMVIPTILITLLGEYGKKIFFNLCYLIPIIY